MSAPLDKFPIDLTQYKKFSSYQLSHRIQAYLATLTG